MISKDSQRAMTVSEESSLTETMKEVSVRSSSVAAINEGSPHYESLDYSVKKNIPKSNPSPESETKIQLSFSVDRLLGDTDQHNADNLSKKSSDQCCEYVYSCCSYLNSLGAVQPATHSIPLATELNLRNNFQRWSLQQDSFHKLHPPEPYETLPAPGSHYMDGKSVLRPTPLRAVGSSCDSDLCASYGTANAVSLLKLHHHQHQQQQQQQQQKTTFPYVHSSAAAQAQLSLLFSPLVTPLAGLKTLHMNSSPKHTPTYRHLQPGKGHIDSLPAMCKVYTSTGVSNHHHHPLVAGVSSSSPGLGFPISENKHSIGVTNTNCSGTNVSVVTQPTSSAGNSSSKRKRSWSRAVFSNLQRKGLEIQFQQQKYITKPDRRKLAARLNLTDAQVKVWFQNRRMKWRHTRENLKSGQEKEIPSGSVSASDKKSEPDDVSHEMSYSSDGLSAGELSENDDDDEIDVVE